MGTNSDNELVEASRRGERDAFGRLVARYQNVVCAVSYSSTGDWAISEDVAQDTFIAAWRQLDQLRDTVRVRPWLCGIARNLARKAKKRTRREDALDSEPVAASASPFDATAQAEAEQVVRDALSRVPDSYREVLVLYYRENRSIRDVAQTLGLSEEAAMQRLSRGRRYLADGVTELVERSLRSPRRNVVAGVLAGIAGLALPSRVDASPTKGSTMLKIALAASVLAAAGTTAVVVHATGDTSAPAPAISHAPAPSPAPIAALAAAAAAPAPSHASHAPALPRPPAPNGAFDHEQDDQRVLSRAELAKLHLDTGPSRGPADAPVTIVVFQDNQCPYCGRALGTLDQLMDEYPNKLRIIVKQFVVHPSARLSAEACYAADAQGKFWEMHDAIFQHQDDLSRDALIEYARQIGLDVTRFTTALDTHAYAKQVADDMAAGKQVGVRGTPAFLINGRELPGAQPIEAFRALVDAALAD